MLITHERCDHLDMRTVQQLRVVTTPSRHDSGRGLTDKDRLLGQQTQRGQTEDAIAKA